MDTATTKNDEPLMKKVHDNDEIRESVLALKKLVDKWKKAGNAFPQGDQYKVEDWEEVFNSC